MNSIFDRADALASVLELFLEPEIEIPKLLPDESNKEEIEELTRQKELREQALADTLEMVQADFEEKAEGYGWVLKEVEARADALKKTKMEIEIKQRALEMKADRLKQALLIALDKVGKKKLVAGPFTYSTRTSKSVVITTENIYEIPDEMLRYSDPEPDKTAVKEYLKNNPDCPWAHMEERTSLIVR